MAGQHDVLHRFLRDPPGYGDRADVCGHNPRGLFGIRASFPTSAGSTVTDNTVTWTAVSSLDFNNYPKSNTSYPDPDVNFTYPDVTSSFLASDTLVPNGLNNPVRVITPSFHRPMQLRNLVPSAQWYTSPITAPYVLYPHVYHQALDSAGKQTGIGRYRFKSVCGH